MIKHLIILSFIFLLISCDDKEEVITKKTDKEETIATEVAPTNKNSFLIYNNSPFLVQLRLYSLLSNPNGRDSRWQSHKIPKGACAQVHNSYRKTFYLLSEIEGGRRGFCEQSIYICVKGQVCEPRCLGSGGLNEDIIINHNGVKALTKNVVCDDVVIVEPPNKNAPSTKKRDGIFIINYLKHDIALSIGGNRVPIHRQECVQVSSRYPDFSIEKVPLKKMIHKIHPTGDVIVRYDDDIIGKNHKQQGLLADYRCSSGHIRYIE